MGWYNAARTREGECYFLDVVDMNYLVFLYFGTIITPALVLAAFYAHIYQVVLKQLRQIVTISPTHGTSSAGRSTSGGTMLRMLGAAQKREVKATQNLSIIVLFFMICWIPLYTINCVIAFCDKCQINSTFMSMCIILSHANSAGNPLLYAYHLKDFREALKNFLCDLFGYTNNARSMSHNNTFAHSRLNSLRESRTYNFSAKKYIESPVYFNRTTKSMSLPTSPKLISIVPKSVALAAATAVDRTDIWRISEVASNVDDHSNNDSSGIHTRPSTPFIKRNSSSSSLKNCSYLNDINYDEDDDVFLDDTLPITDFTCDGVEFQNNLGDGFGKFCEAPALAELKMQSGSCLSSSSPQLSRNLFLVETELNDYKSIRCNSTTDKNEGKRRNGQAGEFICSPSRSIKSPLKVMGEILWNATKYPKSASLSDESNVSPKYRRKNNGSVYTQDNHSFHC